VLLGELTYRLVREHVEVEPVEPLEVNGKAERAAAFRLLAVHDRQASDAARSPLVGRDRETEQVTDALDRVIETRAACELVLLTGETGVGKSRLDEHVCAAATERALVVRGRCLSYGDGMSPLEAVLPQIWRELAELSDCLSPRRRGDSICW
jgi:transcriptional regulator with AAA-type ATPase domain